MFPKVTVKILYKETTSVGFFNQNIYFWAKIKKKEKKKTYAAHLCDVFTFLKSLALKNTGSAENTYWSKE